MDKIQINLYDLLACISNIKDLISPKLSNHHQQVAYLTYQLSEHIGLPIEQQYDIFIAALIHDIGALSTRERLELIETEPVTVNSHAFRSSRLFEGFKPLRNSAGIVKYHHVPWENGTGSKYFGEDVPLASHIIHLADRTCALIKPGQNIMSQVRDILTTIRSQAGSKFRPDLVDVLLDISIKEYIWLDLVSPAPAKRITNKAVLNTFVLEIDDIVDLALVFSRIIDFRSHFTARHSAGVAKIAEKLAQMIGFSPYECKMMLVAGYLHDLGKIAISDEILEKPDKLNEDEFNEMRAHTFYTYYFLEPLEQLRIINNWASFHHEKPNGEGYPFHITGDGLSIGSRIMAVADTFTALTEDRPYRKGLDFETVRKILYDMVTKDELDGRIVKLLIDNYQELDKIRKISQIEAEEQYKKFLLVG